MPIQLVVDTIFLRKKACEDLKRWFNTALGIHIVLPLLAVIIGYPIGVHAIDHWLVIPPDRVAACVWVFRFTSEFICRHGIGAI